MAVPVASVNVIHRNLLWLLLSQVATWGISIVVLVLAPRHLGDSEFGQLTFALTYVMMFELIGLMGTSTYLVKSIARDHRLAGPYVFNTLVMKLCLSVVLSVAAISLSMVLGYSTQTVTIIAIACIGMTNLMVNDAAIAGLQAMERMGRLSLWATVQQYVCSGLGIAVLLTDRGLTAYAITLSCCGFISTVPNILQLWPQLRDSLKINLRLWLQVAKGGLPFLAGGAILLVYGSIDILLLKMFTDNATVGWYAVAYQWVGLPAFFAALVVAAYFPRLSHNAHHDPSAFPQLANKALRLVVFAGVPAAAGIAVVAGPALTLIYHGQFAHSVPLMRILALHIPFVGMDMVLGTAIVAVDRQKQWLLVGCAAAIFNPLANLVLIPLTVRAFSNGAIGAAIVTVATEFLMLVGAVLLRPRGVLDRATGGYILRVVVAAVPIVPVVLVFRDASLAVQIALGVVVYVVMSLLLRTVSTTDISRGAHQLRDQIRTRRRLEPST